MSKSPVAARKPSIKNKNYQILCAVLFLLPTFIVLVSFSYYPAASAIGYSFTRWDGFFDPVFVGLENYARLVKDPIFWLSLRNVLLWSVGSIVVSLIFPYLGAELVFSVKGKRLQYVYRSLLTLPMIVPAVVTIEIWSFIYNPEYGLLNTFFRGIGLEALVQNWLGNSALVIPSLIFIGFPWISGLNFLLFYAGLQNIPGDVLEYAKLDGCGGFRRVFAIDLPLTVSQFKLALILGIINTLQNVTTPLLLTGGGPGYDSYVPGLYMYYEAFTRSNFGYATAIATVMFVMILILTIISMRIQRKDA
ncbi:MAG: carbohydrate ABC transporter permease [Oscillospiraceae bacterium]